MRAKIKKSLSLNTLLPDIRSGFINDETAKIIKEEVIEHITTGKSPVSGFRFKNYSKAYAKLKGKVKPVDMLVTGTMLRSLQAKRTNYSIFLYFKSKVAQFHNETGRVIRRLLPVNRGERFSAPIEKIITRAINNATKVAVKKQNRR